MGFYKKLLLISLLTIFKIFPQEINSSNTIFAFDIHNVIFRYDYSQLLKHLFSKKGSEIIIQILHPKTIFKLIQLLASGVKAPDYMAIELAKVNPNLTQYIDDLLEIENEQLPIPQTLEIIKELKEKGYELHILSNIGELSIEGLKEKYPSIFSNFSKIRTSKLSNPFIAKPKKEAYYEYFQLVGDTNKQIIFIDDKPQNVKAAKELGINGIHFKSPIQLRSKFKKLNVL